MYEGVSMVSNLPLVMDIADHEVAAMLLSVCMISCLGYPTILSVSTLNYLCDLNQDKMWRTRILNVRIQRTKRKQGNCTGKKERDIFYVHTFLDGDTIWRGDLWSMFVDIAQGTRHLKTSFYFYETGYFVCNFQQRERKS